jgi:hypothetical protein
MIAVGGAGAIALAVWACGTNRGPGDADSQSGIRELSQQATGLYDWPQFGGDSRHGGNNTLETKITAQNVGGLQQLFKLSLPETIEGAPVILTNVSTPSGVHDVGYVTTRSGVILAFDAYTGNTLWSHQPTGSQITMSSPAIEPSRNYVYSTGLDGHLHKYAVGDGTEVIGNGWPELFTLKPAVEKGGTAITIATVAGTTYLWMGTGGYDGDGGDYQGHVTTVNLNTGTQNVFNDMCSDQTIHFSSSPDCSSAKSGIWAKAGLTFDPATARLYVATGNGTFNPATHLWGDSLLALNPDGTGVNGGPVDSYTPSNFQTLQNNDKDLGSTNMLVLANNGSKYPHLAAMSGKDQLVRLINLDNMSGQGGPGHVAGEISQTALLTGGENQNPTSTWINPADNSTWVFVVSPSNGINAFRMSVDGSGNPTLVAKWSAGGGGGGSAIANNVLYYASNNNLHALNPTTGAQLWNNTGIGAIHWQTPTIANGVVYIGDNGRQLSAFSLNSETALSRTGWTAVGTPTGGDIAANALDGNAATRWSTGTAMTSGMSFVVDMKAAKAFDEVKLDAGGANDYPRGYQVFVSNDGASFGTAVATGTGASVTVTSKFPAQTARYIKVVLTGGATSWWSISEFNVLTDGSSGGGGGGGGSGGTGAGGATGSAGSSAGGTGGSGTAGGAGGSTLAIDCAGPGASPYVADTDFTGGTVNSHANTIDLSGVTNPAPAAVYQTNRLGTFSYTIPGFAAGSSHTLRLHFAETYFGTAGSRTFNVSLNGTQVLTNFDIFAASGAKNKAIAKPFTVNANASGAYVIQVTSVVNNSLLAGIEVQ